MSPWLATTAAEAISGSESLGVLWAKAEEDKRTENITNAMLETILSFFILLLFLTLE